MKSLILSTLLLSSFSTLTWSCETYPRDMEIDNLPNEIRYIEFQTSSTVFPGDIELSDDAIWPLGPSVVKGERWWIYWASNDENGLSIQPSDSRFIAIKNKTIATVGDFHDKYGDFLQLCKGRPY